jgi:hypothetical protein
VKSKNAAGVNRACPYDFPPIFGVLLAGKAPVQLIAYARNAGGFAMAGAGLAFTLRMDRTGGGRALVVPAPARAVNSLAGQTTGACAIPWLIMAAAGGRAHEARGLGEQ